MNIKTVLMSKINIYTQLYTVTLVLITFKYKLRILYTKYILIQLNSSVYLSIICYMLSPT